MGTGIQLASSQLGVGIIVVLRLVFKGIGHLDALVAIATGNGIANKLDSAFGQGWRRQQPGTAIQNQTSKVGLQFITLDDIHQPQGMIALRQCCSQRSYRVALAHKSHLKGLRLVYLRHEVATLGLYPQLDGCSSEADIDLCPRKGEARTVRMVEADTPDILDMLIRRFNDCSLQGKCSAGLGKNSGSKQPSK